MLDKNDDTRRVDYSTAIPTTITKPLIPGQKVQKIMIGIGCGWHMEQITKGLTPLRRTKISKKHKIRRMKLKNYMNLIGIVMIGNRNYIGTILNGSIQEVKSKGKTLFSFFKILDINKGDRTSN